MFGDRDQSIPVADIEALRTAAAAAPVSTEVVRYPDAGHAFHCDARRSNYHEQSAKDGWARTLAWFAEWLPAKRS
jgi:carboxymethylenebutenolidase